jgi:multidrug efflux pump subunit AcrA (membrane-fusion protein)
VHEVDVDKIKVGQEVDVGIDAYPELKFKGHVEKVGLIAKEKGRWGTSDVKTFDVDILLDGTDPRLKPGMSAKSTIHVNKLEDVVCVPVEAVFEENGKYFCYALKFGKRAKVEIQTGQNNDNFVEVKEGLKEGDTVVLSPNVQSETIKGS